MISPTFFSVFAVGALTPVPTASLSDAHVSPFDLFERLNVVLLSNRSKEAN